MTSNRSENRTVGKTLFNLRWVIILVLVIHGFAWVVAQGLYSTDLAKKMEQQLNDEAKRIEPPVGLSQIAFSSLHKMGLAHVTIAYERKDTDSDVLGFYEKSLSKHGWVEVSQEAVTDSEKPTKGKSATFRKGELMCSVDYSTVKGNKVYVAFYWFRH